MFRTGLFSTVSSAACTASTGTVLGETAHAPASCFSRSSRISFDSGSIRRFA
jgi:hypothetical protein